MLQCLNKALQSKMHGFHVFPRLIRALHAPCMHVTLPPCHSRREREALNREEHLFHAARKSRYMATTCPKNGLWRRLSQRYLQVRPRWVFRHHLHPPIALLCNVDQPVVSEVCMNAVALDILDIVAILASLAVVSICAKALG